MTRTYSAKKADITRKWYVVDANGKTFVAVDRYPNNQPEIAIAAFDASGALVRQLRIDLPYAEYSWSLALGATGDVYYLGFSYSFYDAIFARFTPDVVPKWTEYVGSPSVVDESWKVVSRADGTFFTQGYYYNFSSGESGGETYHLDSAGAIVDTARLPNTGPGGSYLGVQDIALAPDGSLLLAGTSYRSPPRNETPIDGARTLPINASWVSDPVRWYANPTSLVNVTGTLTDPKFPVDDFRGAAEHQAWYGAVDLPASPVSAIAKASVGGPDNRTVSFSANISGGTPPYTYRWSFGDGNASMQPNPTHTYAASGRYPVQLTVEDNATNRAYAFVGLVLGGPPEIDSMSISPNPTYVGQYTSFYATGTDADGSWDDHSVVTQAERPRVFEFVTEGQASDKAGRVKFRQTVVYRYEISPRDTGSAITFVVQPTELGGEFASLAKAPVIGRLVYRLGAMTMRRGPRSLATLAAQRHADRRGI